MSFTIDCAECDQQHTPTCEDCVVSFICGREPEDALVIDVAEERAVRLLGKAGLVPQLRHHRRRDAARPGSPDGPVLGSEAVNW